MPAHSYAIRFFVSQYIRARGSRRAASALVCSTLVLSACAGTVPRLQAPPPESLSAPGYVLSSSPVAEENATTTFIDVDRSVVYFQNSGGSAVVGILFLGALGAVANAALVEAATKADAERLYGKIGFRPREAFADAGGKTGLRLLEQADARTTRITPYLYVSKADGETLYVSSALLVEAGLGAERWAGRYLYQLPLKYSIDELSRLDADAAKSLRAAATDSYAMLSKQIRLDRNERFASEKPIRFESRLLAPAWMYGVLGSLISEEGDVVWIRTTVGVYGLRKSDVRFSLRDDVVPPTAEAPAAPSAAEVRTVPSVCDTPRRSIRTLRGDHCFE